MFITILARSRRIMRSGIGGYTTDASGTYEDALKALNNLQSNASYLRDAKKKSYKDKDTLEQTGKYMRRSGMSLERLDALSVIHVAGTKGKGSTCAFAECLLRAHGMKTGLYSSPHLISVRERLKINGRPIEERKFRRYFWKLYKSLEEKREYESDMPSYFMFLTILMFHVFSEEPIDVAIIEVGIGGELDCTNVVRNPVCVGVTRLGLDHTELLGATLREIARQKAGIFKSGTMAFTVPQPAEAMAVLERRAIEQRCGLIVVPPLKNYAWLDGETPRLGIPAEFQSYNASIAISMASAWMSLNSLKKMQSFWFDTAAVALTRCRLPGRTQLLRVQRTDYYLDGAHTLESIEYGAVWFARSTGHSAGKRILIFNATGNRDSVGLLGVLRRLSFDAAYFVPNVAGRLVTVDQINYNNPIEEQMQRCRQHRSVWGEGAVCAASIGQALDDINANENLFSSGRLRILVTGSLHLVGAALVILDPDLSVSTGYR